MGTKFSKFTDSVSKRFCSPNGTNENCSVPSEEKHETGHDPAVHGARLEDRNYNNEGFKRKPFPPEMQQKEVAAAVTVQTQYRQHAAKEEVNEIKEEVAATKIQAGFRGYLDREAVRKMKSESGKKSRRSEAVSDDRGSQDSQPVEKQEIVDIDLADPEVAKAATFIQSGFKGFKARKTTPIVLPEPEWPEETRKVVLRLSDKDIEEAATKIQAQFKGYLTRKGMEKVTTPFKSKTLSLSEKSPTKEQEKAAIKIQAGIRGHLVRKRNKDIFKKLKSEEQFPLEQKSTEEESAIIIESAVRGYLSHEKSKSIDNNEPVKDDENENNNARETRDDDENYSNSARETNDYFNTVNIMEPDYSQAALRIQAGFRGLQSRKEIQRKKELREQQHHESEQQESHDVTESQDEMPDLGDPDVEKAAVKIQAGFKGLKARKELRKQKEEREIETEKSDLQDDSGELGENIANRDEMYGAEGTDSEEIDESDRRADHAAVKIQAGFRGYKTRKSLKHPGGRSDPEYTEVKLQEDGPSAGDVEHGHSKNRPDPDQAATRIQASYKGYKTRKELKSRTSVHQHVSHDDVDAGDQKDGADTQRSQGHVNMDDPEVQKAVVKIQAGFKGMKARQEVKAKIAEKKTLTLSQESEDIEDGGTEEEMRMEEEQMQGSSFIEVSQDEVEENEGLVMFGGALPDKEENEIQETEELTEDGPHGDETLGDETQADETQADETQADETNEQPEEDSHVDESLTDDM